MKQLPKEDYLVMDEYIYVKCPLDSKSNSVDNNSPNCRRTEFWTAGVPPRLVDTREDHFCGKESIAKVSNDKCAVCSSTKVTVTEMRPLHPILYRYYCEDHIPKDTLKDINNGY